MAEGLVESTEVSFKRGLEDDLNMPIAMAAFFDFIREGNKALDSKNISASGARLLLDLCHRMDQVFGVLNVDGIKVKIPSEIEEKVKARELARKNRDYSRADILRREIIASGWRIEDTSKGTRVIRGNQGT